MEKCGLEFRCGVKWSVTKVRQGQAYRVPRMESRVKVRMENRKVMDMEQGSWKQTWVKGEQRSEYQYGVAQSVTG